ncbi:hypothetical protein WDV06_06310 [Streptomyces racemochromogenes]|uniref:Uncharacterized protein n=1 Tax=Streptomyces racemochromogenes TaxID=67353 RepID=A0ABW7P8N8_9ACTN
MTTLETPSPRAGRRRRTTPPGYEESVQQTAAHPAREQPRPGPPGFRGQPDPPIYAALLARWAADGRTLPGRRDPDWSRIASDPIWPSGPLFG